MLSAAIDGEFEMSQKRSFLFILFISFFCLSSCSSNKDWRTASRESAKIAPLPSELNESIVQIYYARAFNWRGYVGVHPWVSWKLKNEKSYTVAQILGYRLERTGSSLVVENDIPDRYWFGEEPVLLYDVQGEKAEAIIANFKKLIETYPHKNKYVIWPGPNSNTFVDYLIRRTPEIKIELPPHAIGKDWPSDYLAFSQSPSGTGGQFSVFGVFGLTLGLSEGVELNVLGLNFGIDFWNPALKLPFVGRLGFPKKEFISESVVNNKKDDQKI